MSTKLKAILFSVSLSVVIFVLIILLIFSAKTKTSVKNENKDQAEKVEKKENIPSVINYNYQPKEGIFFPATDQHLEYVNIKEYRDFLLESYKMPADFYGHYKVVIFGCGSGCSKFEIIDKNDGFLYKLPEQNDFGNFIGREVFKPYSIDSNLIHLITNKGTVEKIYSFDGKDFILTSVKEMKSR